jgi:hypothetical protein
MYRIRIFSGPLNVRWFGARGDGVHDKSPAIRRAIAATTHAGIGSVNAGGRIYIPKGEYRLTGEKVFLTRPGGTGLEAVAESDRDLMRALAGDRRWRGLGGEARSGPGYCVEPDEVVAFHGFTAKEGTDLAVLAETRIERGFWAAPANLGPAKLSKRPLLSSEQPDCELV